MAIKGEKYNSYAVLTNTVATYNPGNRNLIEVSIEIKGMQSEWFWLRYINDKPEMWRGLSLRQQQGPELEKEKNNLGTVEVTWLGKRLRFFQDYDSFWKEITK